VVLTGMKACFRFNGHLVRFFKSGLAAKVPVRFNSPLQIKWPFGVLQIFKKVRRVAFIICSGLSYLTKSSRRRFYSGQGACEAVKALCGLIERTILDIFMIKSISPQETGIRCKTI
jgi:hypothetical protein